MTWESVFGPMNGNRTRAQIKRNSLKNAKWRVLEVDTWFNGMEYAAGSQYKVWETENFGWVAFHPSSKSPDGSIPARYIHKY